MLVGGVLCAADAEAMICSDLDALLPGRPAHWSYEWKHIRETNSERYADFVDLFFRYNKEHILDFRCVVLECAKFDHRTYNDGDGEIGFNKFLYQYLLSHNRHLGPRATFRCYHDRRTSKYDLREVCQMLNNRTARRDIIPQRRYKEVAYGNLRTHPLMQFADVLIGAVGFCKNSKDKGSPLSPKSEVANYIRKSACLASLSEKTPPSMKHFDIWDFDLKSGTQGA